MTNEAYAIVSVVSVSLLSLLGLTALVLNERPLRLLIFLSVGFAAGALFGDAFIHLIPESFDRLSGQTSLFILVGILIFFVLEKFLRWHHHLGPETGLSVKPVGYLNLVADSLHNFVDGILIGSSYLVSTKIGLATTIAVVLHEIPQEIGDFGILLHAGFTRTRALFFNFLSAVFAIAGAAIALWLGEVSSYYSVVMLPITAGGFIYIAGSDLVPELQQEVTPVKSVAQVAALIGGAAVMYLIA